MKTNHLFASAAVAAVLVVSAPAQAQILGGALGGGAGGPFAGSFGSFGATGANGRLAASSDASLHGSIPARPAAHGGAGNAGTVGARGVDTIAAAAQADRENSSGVGQAAMSRAASTAHPTPQLDAGAESTTAVTTELVNTGGHAMTSESGNPPQANRPERPTQNSGRATKRDGIYRQENASGAQKAEKRSSATHIDTSTSASAETSANASTRQ